MKYGRKIIRKLQQWNGCCFITRNLKNSTIHLTTLQGLSVFPFSIVFPPSIGKLLYTYKLKPKFCYSKIKTFNFHLKSKAYVFMKSKPRRKVGVKKTYRTCSSISLFYPNYWTNLLSYVYLQARNFNDIW